MWANIIRSGNVGGAQDQCDTGCGANRFNIHRSDVRMGMFTERNIEMQHSGRFRQVINVGGAARHVFVPAVMGERGFDVAFDAALYLRPVSHWPPAFRPKRICDRPRIRDKPS